MSQDWLAGTGHFAAPNAIFDRTDLLASDKLVYLYLCRRAGNDGTSWPSIRRTARDTGLQPNTVRAALQRLEAAGLITRQPRRSEHGDPDSYLYVLNQVVQTTTHPVQTETQVVQIETYGVVQKTTQGGSKGDPEGKPLKDTQDKELYISRPRKRVAGKGEEPDPRVKPVIDTFWSEYRRRFGKDPPEEIIKPGYAAVRIRKLPDDYGPDDLVMLVKQFFDPDTPRFVTRDFKFTTFLGAIPQLLDRQGGGDLGNPAKRSGPVGGVSRGPDPNSKYAAVYR